MKIRTIATGFILSFTTLLYSSGVMAQCTGLLNYETNKLRSSEKLNFCNEFDNKVLLVVNTASQCGFTPQFKELEALYQKYKNQGLVIVGFPSNDFRQEYDNQESIAKVCYVNYGVTFNMVSTSSVRGLAANSFYKSLLAKSGEVPAWNFNKYLISRDTLEVQHFGSTVKPLDGELEKQIALLLKE